MGQGLEQGLGNGIWYRRWFVILDFNCHRNAIQTHNFSLPKQRTESSAAK